MNDSAHVFTLGIEEEFQIIDPETRELRSHVQQILDDVEITLKEFGNMTPPTRPGSSSCQFRPDFSPPRLPL